MSNPLLFISHKHDDREIGLAVANFVRSITGGNVDVYLSSEPRFKGPRAGKKLNDELKNALWESDVVVLIYTSEDKDWSYCMWECGIAVYPDSPDTKVVVLQCMEDKPKVFASSLNVTAWDKNSVISFANRFRDADFFPGSDKPVTGLKESELREKAEQFFKELSAVIPQAPSQNWSAWPFLRLEFSNEMVHELVSTHAESKEKRNHLLGQAKVVNSSSGLSRLFGRSEIIVNSPFSELIEEWTNTYPKRTPGWLDVIYDQVMDGARKRLPRIRYWERFREVNGTGEHVPGVGRIKRNQMFTQIDCYFLGTANVPRVTSPMVTLDHIHHKDLVKRSASDINLRELLNQFEDWNRIPVFENKKPKYMIHVSMINRFVRQKAFLGEPVNDLTLENLLEDEVMSDMFANTFAIVSEDATLDDAVKAMSAIENCQDVFITQNGTAKEVVEGWLTDKDITKALQRFQKKR